MEDQLRSWARTGEYHEDARPLSSQGPQRPQRPAGGRWMPDGPWLVLMIPAGVTIGLLFAIATLLRLLALPFLRSGHSPESMAG